MNNKKPSLKKNSKFYQGRYEPKYKEKYVGNPYNIIYRSRWELMFMRMCDWNENVVKWSSESLVIPYLYEVDHKIHKYYVDFCMWVGTNTGEMKKFLIEIKPSKDCSPPNKRSKYYEKQLLTWIKNCNKWVSAKRFAEENDCEFKILTEKELFGK